MHIGRVQVKRRVWFGLLFVFAAISSWWMWNRAVITPITAVNSQPKSPAVRLAKTGAETTDSILREKAEYSDPTPLFFPTEWNYGREALREDMKRQPGQIFGSFESKFVFGDQNLKLYGSETTVVSGRLADVVASGNETPLAGIGEMDLKRVALPERGGFLEVRRLSDGEAVITQTVTRAVGLQNDFAPLEFLMVISSAGVVGEPVLIEGSGMEAIDVFFRTYIAKSFRLGGRLTPGLYRILVGP